MKALVLCAALGAVGFGCVEWAQAKGGGHGGGGHGGGHGHSSSHHGSSHSSHGYVHHASYHPHYYGGSGYYFPSYGYSYGYGVNYGSTYPVYSNSVYGYSQPIPTIVPASATVVVPPVQNGPATIQVVAPAADAEIMLDNNKTTSVGRNRLFTTPNLEAGYRYAYTVTATWTQDGKSMRDARTVDVAPGRVSVVDFTRPAAPEMVPPPAKIDPSKL